MRQNLINPSSTRLIWMPLVLMLVLRTNIRSKGYIETR